ncbi:MAG TPA: GFA family protein [Gammaproteobacteria bacterium]|nr:GFA family protein [Gammaproteobacteria bacterium]
MPPAQRAVQAEGGCLCGALRYRVDGPLVDAGYCHCRLCQRASGAPVVAWFTIEAGCFAWTAGSPRVYRSSAVYQRESCAVCGSQLVFRRSVAPRYVDVTIASLDAPAAVVPEYHIWRMSRLPWFDTADALPRHEDAGPDQS